MIDSSDIVIMMQVKAGDSEKLAILFERYKEKLFAYFYRLTRDRYSSEDLVQNVFMRLFKYRQRFSGYGSFAAWMYQIAHHVFIDHIHKNSRYKAVAEFHDGELVDDNTQDRQYEKKEQLQLLEKALHRLSEDKREILVLAKFQGVKYKEIGEILNCTEANVKVRVYRAIVELKEIYAKLEDTL